MKARRLNWKRGKNKSKQRWLHSTKKLEFVILEQVNVISLLSLQILAAIENYQYSRMIILHMNLQILANIL